MSSPGVDWLDEAEQHTWRLYRATTMILEASLERQLQRDADMPHAYYTLLAILASRPGRSCRMTALANATFTSQSRTSHAIAALEKRGWVRRERCTDDTRGNLAILTDAGARVLAQAAPAHVREVRRSVFDQLSSEQVVALGEICSSLLAGLDPDGASALNGP